MTESSLTSKRKPRRPIVRRLFGMIVIITAVFVLAYYLMFSPQQVARRAVVMMEQLTGAQAYIGSAEFSFDGTIQLHDVTLDIDEMGPNPASDFFHAAHITVHYRRSGLWRGRIDPTKIVLVDPVLTITEDVERDLLNVQLLTPIFSGDGEMSLPEISADRGEFRFAQVHDGSYHLMGILPVQGELSTVSKHPNQYHLELRQSVAQTDVATAFSLDADIDTFAHTVRGTIRGLSFVERFQNLLPSKFRNVLDEFELTGSLPNIAFFIDREAGWRIDVPIHNVQLILPPLAKDKDRLQLIDVSGLFWLTEDGLHFDRIIGTVAGRNDDNVLIYRVDGEIDGYSIDAPFNIQLKTVEPLNIPEKPTYIHALPESVQKVFRMLTFVGQVGITMDIWRDKTADVIEYEGYVKIIDTPSIDTRLSSPNSQLAHTIAQQYHTPASGQFEHFPYKLTNCHGTVVFSKNKLRDEIRIKKITGNTSGNSTATITGVFEPLGKHPSIDLNIVAENIPLDSKLYEAFDDDGKHAIDLFFCKSAYDRLLNDGWFVTPNDKQQARAAHRKISEQLSRLDTDALDEIQKLQSELNDLESLLAKPQFAFRQAHADANIHVVSPYGKDKPIDVIADVVLHDADFVFEHFTYPMRVTSGKLKISPSGISLYNINAIGLHGGELVFSGDVVLPKQVNGDIKPDLNLDVKDMPVDLLFYQALPEPQNQFVQNLNLTGRIDVVGHVFTDDQQQTDVDMHIKIDKAVAYPGDGRHKLSDVRGELRLSLHDANIDHFAARHDDEQIEITGHADWSEPDNPQTSLHAKVTDMRLLETVLDLLKPFSDVSQLEKFWSDQNIVGLTDVDVTYNRQGDKITYNVRLDPSELAFDYNNERVNLTDVTGSMEFVPGKVILEGFGAVLDDNVIDDISGIIRLDPELMIEVDLKCRIDNFTPVTQAVLPLTVMEVVNALKVEGAFDIDFALLHSPYATVGINTRIDGIIALDGVSCELGIPIRDIHGNMGLKWNQQIGSDWPVVRAAIKADRLIAFDRPVTEFEGTLNNGDGCEVFNAPLIGGWMCDGRIVGSMALALEAETYNCDLWLSGVKLEEFWGYASDKDLSSSDASNKNHTSSQHNANNMRGLMSANLVLRGMWDRPETRIGTGKIRITQAQIYDLPLVWGLLQITHLALPIPSVFDRAQIDYYLNANTVTFERIILESLDVSMAGGGTFDYLTDAIDLTLTSSNPQAISLGPLSDMLNILRDQFFTIYVNGTLSDPVVQVQPFSGFTDAWQDVFGKESKPLH